jgi:hypothetical protein
MNKSGSGRLADTMFITAMMLGLIGLVGMALLGVTAGGHGHSSHGRTGHGHSGHSHSSHGHISHHVGHGHATHLGERLLALASPRVIFSLALGFGAVGLAVGGVLPPVLAIVVAVLGGLAFERWLVSPYWTALSAFASKPANNLESAVMGEAQAETDFDVSGAGLVSLEMDGQVRQLLGRLEPRERDVGLRVRRGERLRVLAVRPDGSCVVSKLH